MTDTITPASLRAHADWMEQKSDGERPAFFLRAAANQLEAESARDEKQVEELAKVLSDFAIADEHSGQRDDMQLARLLVARGVRVEPTQRPASVPDTGPRTWPSLDQVPHDVVVTGGPRSNPAAWSANLFGGHETWRWQNNDSPVPAEYHQSVWTEVLQDSGPDGTPEKPWPTWQEIPNGVKYVSRDHNCVEYWWWVNRSIGRYTENNRGELRLSETSQERMVNHYAPFVRVDGDQA